MSLLLLARCVAILLASIAFSASAYLCVSDPLDAKWMLFAGFGVAAVIMQAPATLRYLAACEEATLPPIAKEMSASIDGTPALSTGHGSRTPKEAEATVVRPRGAIGVVAVMISPDGGAVADASDFSDDGYGGYTLLEAQTKRAKDLLKATFTEAHLPKAMAGKFDSRFAGDFLALAERSGYRLEVVTIGHHEAG